MVGLHPPLLQQVAVKLGHLHSMTMKAYSVDLRTKVVESVRRGIAKSETAVTVAAGVVFLGLALLGGMEQPGVEEMDSGMESML